jgi:hypothetical protein
MLITEKQNEPKMLVRNLQDLQETHLYAQMVVSPPRQGKSQLASHGGPSRKGPQGRISEVPRKHYRQSMCLAEGTPGKGNQAQTSRRDGNADMG